MPQGDYEERLRGAFARAQNLKGPLDGGWLVQDPGSGRTLYRLQIVDEGLTGGGLEGVWSEAADDGPEGWGFLSQARRAGTDLSLGFTSRTHGVMMLELHPRAGGGYQGEMIARGTTRAPVVMLRPADRAP